MISVLIYVILPMVAVAGLFCLIMVKWSASQRRSPARRRKLDDASYGSFGYMDDSSNAVSGYSHGCDSGYDGGYDGGSCDSSF
jgi:hypothetical protein